MELPVNKFKRALEDKKPQIGMWSSLSSHIVAEILAHAGFDWVLLDTEHSPNELPMVQSQLQAMTGGRLDAAILRQLLIALAMIGVMLLRPQGLWTRPERLNPPAR